MSLGANNIYASVRSAKSGTGNLLKAFLLLLIAVMVAVSCQKNDQLPEEQIPVKVSVNASSAKSLTKVALNDDLGMRWQSGDKLSVVAATSEGAAASSVLTLKEGADSGTALFEGLLDIPEVPSECWFVYPAEEQNDVTGPLSIDDAAGVVTFLYECQSGGHTPFMASAAAPYKPSGINATLHLIGGVLAVTLPDGVANITFQGNNGEKLSEYKYDIKTGTGEIDGNAAQSFSVAVDAAGLCYINVPPVKFEKGFTLLLQGTDGKVMYKSFNYSGGCDFSTAPAQGEQVTSACLKGALIELSVDSFEPYGLASSEVSWSHTYDGAGILTGSQVKIGGVALQGAPESLVTGYKVELKNGSGTIVRSYSSTSIPSQTITLDVTGNWPYLPQGDYTLTQTVTTIYGTTTHEKEVKVGAPSLKTEIKALTSYSYYKGEDVAKDINQANNCDNATIYGISAEIKISSEILNNSNYGKPELNSFTLDGNSLAVNAATIGSNAYNFAYSGSNAANQSWASHNFVASLTFDGVTVETSKKVEITGLPYSFVFYNNENGLNSSGWTKKEVSYSIKKCTIQNDGSNGYLISPEFNIPDGVQVGYETGAQYYRAWGLNVSGKSIYLYIGVTASTSSVATSYNSHEFKGDNSTGQSYSTCTGTLNLSKENRYISLYHNKANVSSQVDYLAINHVIFKYQ